MKKVLVISNGCFSLTDSNGRTLAKLFNGYDPTRLAHLHTYGTPDFNVCSNYYKISDRDALKSFLTRKPCGGVVVNDHKQTEAAPVVGYARKGKKTPFKMLLRELAWRFSKCRSEALDKWLKDFSPEEILLFAGDGAFLMDLAAYVAAEFNIPVTIYSTEDYCFKDYNYITKRKSLFYRAFKKNLDKSYRNIEKYVKQGFFNTDLLTEMYASRFSFPCSCMYARSDMDFSPRYTPADMSSVNVSYLGNLGLNRHLPLCEIADTLAKIAPGAKLNVYGSAKPDVEKALKDNPNVDFKGFVDYEQVVSIIHNSDLLVHTEYDDDYNLLDLKAAFSTKIPDSISSGTPLLLYANESLACTDFVIKNQCAFVATQKNQLEEVLEKALSSEEERRRIIDNAEQVKARCFTAESPMIEFFI